MSSDELAQAVWCAVSALWHPSLLSQPPRLPRIESVDSPSTPGAARGPGDRQRDVRTGSLPATGPRPRMPDRLCSSREPTAPT